MDVDHTDDGQLSIMDHGRDKFVTWQRRCVTSPVLADPVPVIAANGISYRVDGNRLQTLGLYLPRTDDTEALVGTPIRAIPALGSRSNSPAALVHIHGGAWRSPDVTAASIEPTVACAFATPDDTPIKVIASIDYSISPFPNAPTAAYDPRVGAKVDPARQAIHPQHIEDVLRAFGLLRSLGLSDGSYILSGHSCGACLAFQAVLAEPADLGLRDVCAPPIPAAVLGVNGLYDLPDLVHHLDASHAHLEAEYRDLLTIAFGADEHVWAAASPTRFDLRAIASHRRRSGNPATILLEQSPDDRLVPMTQRETLARRLRDADLTDVVKGSRCSGSHAAPWEHGDMMWRSILDILDRYRSLKPQCNTSLE